MMLVEKQNFTKWINKKKKDETLTDVKVTSGGWWIEYSWERMALVNINVSERDCIQGASTARVLRNRPSCRQVNDNGGSIQP